mgnify:CR=1 FL=1
MRSFLLSLTVTLLLAVPSFAQTTTGKATPQVIRGSTAKHVVKKTPVAANRSSVVRPPARPTQQKRTTKPETLRGSRSTSESARGLRTRQLLVVGQVATALVLLIFLFFITSVIGVVTGSNSLVTVPVMFQFGIDPKKAVATNMFGLTFMNVGATIPFLRRGTIDIKKVTPLVFITLIASAIGAGLVLLITPANIKLLVSIAMIGVTIFTLVKRDAGIKKSEAVLPQAGGLNSDGILTTAIPRQNSKQNDACGRNPTDLCCC